MAGDLQIPGLPPERGTNLQVGTHGSRALQPKSPYKEGGTEADASHQIAAILRRRLGTILLVFLPVFPPVTAYSLLSPKTYESSALILVEERSPRLESSALAALDRLGRGSQVDTEMELIKSRRVVERVVDQHDLPGHVTGHKRWMSKMLVPRCP